MAKRVLVVDDANFMRTIVKDTLAPNGFEIVGEATNGIEAVTQYARLKPDLVTMDITMKVKDGLEAAREILAADPNARIVMVTALGQEKMLMDSIALGVRDFVIKPFTAERILSAVEKKLSNRNGGRTTMVKINAKIVNPFIEAAMRVVSQIAGIEVRRGHLSYKEKAEPSYGVSIIIGIYGFLTGQIVYSLDGKLAERLVDKMLEGKPPQEKKIMFLDCLGEVANMITGNAVSLLNQRHDQVLNITTPAIATGTNLNVHLLPKAALVLGLITPYGPIEISIAVEEQEALQEMGLVDDGLLSEI